MLYHMFSYTYTNIGPSSDCAKMLAFISILTCAGGEFAKMSVPSLRCPDLKLSRRQLLPAEPGESRGAIHSLARRAVECGVRDIAIAVKARPDSITEESIRILDQLGLFRVFLGVENASENGLRNLNRKNTVTEILNALH
jgi:histone acetyltransferase (RNA polymerase elongator complex component)